MNLDAALAYAERHTLQALLVMRDGATLLETYANGGAVDAPHKLFSGTKAFWGLTAAAAQDDGLLAFDEPVAATIPAWNDGTSRAHVTLRQLLSLTAGIPFGGLGNAVPTYEKALATALVAEPGERFTYGGIPLQIVGAVLAAKLGARGLTPHAYLRERLLAPLGIDVAAWRTLRDGTQPLPTGASLTARAWACWGAFVAHGGVAGSTRMIDSDTFAACFRGSSANPRYGLGWWLHPIDAPEIVYASGAGGQALYVVPSERIVVVHFSDASSFKHETFLTRLFHA